MKSENKIQEMQFLEQNLQNILFQKQAFQIELSETESALSQIQEAGEEVFKIIGQLMIKASREKLKDELLNKQKILDLRLKTIEKQESSFTKKLEELRSQVIKKQD